MPRAPLDPRDALLSGEECARRLGVSRSAWWNEVLKRDDALVLHRGRRCIGSRVRWKASALAAFMESLPSEPTRRPPAAGIAKRAETKAA